MASLLTQGAEVWGSVVAAITAALDDQAVGPVAAARNRSLAMGAATVLAVTGIMYLRKALHLTAEDRASQRRKTSVQLQLKPVHRQFLREVTARYHFKDESKALRMIVDFANQDTDTDTIFTVERVSATSGLADAETTNFVLDKESHVEWLVKMKQGKGLASIDQALAAVLDYVMALTDKTTVFEIDRSTTRPVHGEPSIILSIKS